jgi:hypothetical protein
MSVSTIANRETVGKISSELLAKSDDTHSVAEQMRENLSEYEKDLLECVHIHQKTFPSRSFYVVVLTRGEKLMPNVLRNQFMALNACPTPQYDQAVFFYDHSEERIEFLWVLPCKKAYKFLKKYALQIPPEQRQLLQFVLEDADGTLLRKAKIRNKETINSL